MCHLILYEDRGCLSDICSKYLNRTSEVDAQGSSGSDCIMDFANPREIVSGFCIWMKIIRIDVCSERYRE